MRARVNPFVRSAGPERPSPDAVREFHRSLPGYAPTPLHSLPGLARSLGLGAVYVKDESFRFGLSAFKALGAAWAIQRIRAQRPGALTVATATAGHHGRAVAWAARRLGLSAVIFIPARAAPARVEALRREGATVELVDGSYDDAVARCAARSSAEGWQVISDTGYAGYLEIPRWIAEGYQTLFGETRDQLEAAGLAAPNVVLVQAGVGGLLHGAVSSFRCDPIPPILVAVEPAAADALISSIESPDGQPSPATGPVDSIMAGLNCGTVSLSAWTAVRSGVQLFVAIPDRFAEAAMRQWAAPLAGDPRIVAGESGAAGLGGLLAILTAPELAIARDYLRAGPETRVLLLNTEGATDPEGYRRIVGTLP